VSPLDSVQIRAARPRPHEGRRTLDLAEGILIGLHRYPTQAAFEELVSVAGRHGLSVSVVASALVALATGETGRTETPSAADIAVELEWSHLLRKEV
jgi:MFS superfamily sulfate permease-like transporter